MRPLLFRVLASEKTGTGHLMRSLALAQAAESCDIPSIFLLDTHASLIARKRHDWNYQIISVPANLSVSNEGKWIAEQADEHDAAALIFDGYTFSPDVLKNSHHSNRCVVLMDDGMTSLTHLADIIVDPTAKERTSTEQQVFCYGSKYRLLRREFTTLSPKLIKERNGIALNLGGSDPKNLTIHLLKAISNRLPDVPIRVVTGPAYSRLTELDSCVASLPNPIQHIHNCQDMSEVWNNAKLAISAAGGSQFELGVCATPSILVVVAKNQKQATKAATMEGWATAFDCIKTIPIDAIAKQVQTLLDADLQAMSDRAKGLYDAEGAMRLLNNIAEYEND
ncbi:UDP-2,4-diacetamido-2,4,6-trideoxy-beta-L-altropyranose hydrolase [Alteromonas sp. ASW11-130]|uniref:UDP-2,4-diacetamido-2,4, 6-trideoxy-beta-L-altropyranose hydrolase n=1 Tax=Alteromonas sp. ASW11-130 TaxID=3015775 RepID=UPI002242A1B8|nr:UDP-2,4-diacetamido-2,4,6-trideoxy-beta-L-altropyranose hydrolase [Alteromonas sp. ASW11-130]MCW8090334.1 UDP-2,4-diacetamido-2,4,6-trideoxy-beta-L-altropyranose hydrolase [Alteromonas sp. ASW11-130]